MKDRENERERKERENERETEKRERGQAVTFRLIFRPHKNILTVVKIKQHIS